MHHEYYDSANRKTAVTGIVTDDYWTTAELNLQPHAWNVHGDYPLHQPPFGWVNEGLHHAFNTTGAYSPRQRLFGCDNHGLYHHFNDVVEPLEILHRSSGELSQIPSFDCHYPRCHATFLAQWMLDEHSKVHINILVPRDGASLKYGGNADGLGLLPDEAMKTNVQSMYGRPALAMTGNVSVAVPEPAFTSEMMYYHEPLSYSNADAVASEGPAQSLLNAGSSIAALPNDRFACSHPGCNTTCARPGDLQRHLL
ncbi:MAG: hypothetical protein LQ343_004454 [Gyalolechia ehrenbergii]|nr:MAG: hypothetical protein LQ343_004454 [Gyalolechia ehrenbergii]